MQLVQFRSQQGDLLITLPDRWQDEDQEVVLARKGIRYPVRYICQIHLFDGDMDLSETKVFCEVHDAK